MEQLHLALKDTEWPYTYTDHERPIARAIVVDDDGLFYFARINRDDEFGKATLIETSGGGVEPGEEPVQAVQRELLEELGVQVDVLMKIGEVWDYYNLIHRRNLNHYYLCRVRGFAQSRQTVEEMEQFHLTTLCLRYGDAEREYERRADTPLGRLLANRELPVLRRAREILENMYPEIRI